MNSGMSLALSHDILGAELSEEASVCTSCGTVQDETDIQESQNLPEPSPEGIGRRTRQNTAANRTMYLEMIKRFILAPPDAMPSEPDGKTTKPKRAGKRTNRKKRRR